MRSTYCTFLEYSPYSGLTSHFAPGLEGADGAAAPTTGLTGLTKPARDVVWWKVDGRKVKKPGLGWKVQTELQHRPRGSRGSPNLRGMLFGGRWMGERMKRRPGGWRVGASATPERACPDRVNCKGCLERGPFLEGDLLQHGQMPLSSLERLEAAFFGLAKGNTK